MKLHTADSIIDIVTTADENTLQLGFLTTREEIPKAEAVLSERFETHILDLKDANLESDVAYHVVLRSSPNAEND